MSDPRPVLDQFNLVVQDMKASVAFYRRLGMEIEDGQPEWDPHHRTVRMPDGVDLDLDSAEFAKVWNRGWPGSLGNRMGVLGFRVASRDEVDRLYTELTDAGYLGQQPPYDAFWGARYAVVEDPDGNPVGLMSPVDAALRTPSPSPPGRL